MKCQINYKSDLQSTSGYDYFPPSGLKLSAEVRSCLMNTTIYDSIKSYKFPTWKGKSEKNDTIKQQLWLFSRKDFATRCGRLPSFYD